MLVKNGGVVEHRMQTRGLEVKPKNILIIKTKIKGWQSRKTGENTKTIG